MVMETRAMSPRRAPNSHVSHSLSVRGKHIPTIDGLRGIAVLLVVIFHIFQSETVPDSGLPRFLHLLTRFGQTGVDLFFVLSGFLITGILFDAKGSSRYFFNFYGRRTVRIFPLYYGVLIAVLLLLPAILGIRLRGVDPIWLWTYTTNIPLAFGAEPGDLGLFWTLAIEEQFYLIWPTIVYFSNRKVLSRICVGCIAGAFVSRIIAESLGISSFTFTLCRMDTLTLGALLAMVVRGSWDLAIVRKVAKIIGLVSAFMMTALFLFKSGDGTHWVQVVKYSPTAAFYGSVLILVVTAAKETRAARFLASGPLVNLGRYSYGLYVYQGFVIVWSTTALSNARLLSIGIPNTYAMGFRVATILVLTYGAAWISWHLFEKHFLILKKYFETKSVEGTRPLAKPRPVLTWRGSLGRRTSRQGV